MLPTSSSTFSLSNQEICQTPDFKMTTNPFTETLYKIGILLTRPFLFEVSQATKLYSKHLRPGKDFAELRLKGKVWHILKISTLFTLVLPLLALILAGIGFLFRMIGSRGRPEAFLLRNKKIKDHKIDSKNSISIMTYNMALNPKYMGNLGNMRSSKIRASEISNTFLTLGKNAPDVLCAQECFSSEALEKLCQTLKVMYPYIIYGVAPNEFGVSSGLLIASKFEITECAYMRFPNLIDEDAWSNKGVLGVNLNLGSQNCWVFNAHLQAKNDGIYESVRLDQMSYLKFFVEKTAKNAITFIAGDFNLSHISDFGKPSKTLMCAEQVLGKGYKNLFYLDHPTGSSWYDKSDWGHSHWQKKTVAGCVVDHIFVSNIEIDETQTSLFVKEMNPLSGQSDHLPLYAEMKLVYR